MASSAAAPFPSIAPSTIILNPDSQTYVDQANLQIGPWLMGAFVDLFLQGILMAQVTHYFLSSSGDSSRRRFSWLVVVLTILCILRSSQIIKIVWDTVVTNFANPDLARILVNIRWWHYTEGLFTAIIAAIVQSFFVYRYWMLTRRWYLCAVMICGMIVSMIGASMVIPALLRNDIPTVQKWAQVHFAAAIIADTLITSLTAFHLYRQKTMVYSSSNNLGQSYVSDNGRTTMELRVIRSTANMIDQLIRMIWQSALPPTLCVIMDVIMMAALPNAMIHISFNITLPKLYAISLVYTLNVGNKMRDERTSSNGITIPTTAGVQTLHLARRSFGGTELGSRATDSTQRTGDHLERGLAINGRSTADQERKIDILAPTRRTSGEVNLGLGDVKLASVREGGDSDMEREAWEAKS